MFLRKRQKGQSTVEYIVLVTAVIAIIIAFLVSPASPFAKRMNASMDSVTNKAESMANDIVAAQTGFDTNAVGTDFLGNKVSQGLCGPGKYFDPSRAPGSECI